MYAIYCSLRTWNLTHGDHSLKKAAFSETQLSQFPKLGGKRGVAAIRPTLYHQWSHDQGVSHKTKPCLQTSSNSSAVAGGEALHFCIFSQQLFLNCSLVMAVIQQQLLDFGFFRPREGSGE